MQTRQAVAIGTSVSKAEGSHVSDSWEILDILIEKSLAEKLSDEMCIILMRIVISTNSRH